MIKTSYFAHIRGFLGQPVQIKPYCFHRNFQGFPLEYRDLLIFCPNWHALCKTLGMHKPTPSSDKRWDLQRRFIRIVHEHDNGMVEFEFAVGEPELFVEMVMPRAEFEDFCAMHQVVPTMGPLPAADLQDTRAEWDWSLRDAREQHFRDTD